MRTPILREGQRAFATDIPSSPGVSYALSAVGGIVGIQSGRIYENGLVTGYLNHGEALADIEGAAGDVGGISGFLKEALSRTAFSWHGHGAFSGGRSRRQ